VPASPAPEEYDDDDVDHGGRRGDVNAIEKKLLPELL
jgi:hypothetical protein